MVVETLQHLQVKIKPSTTLCTTEGLLVSGTTWGYALQYFYFFCQIILSETYHDV